MSSILSEGWEGMPETMSHNHNLPQPLLVYFLASRTQAADAIAIARHLNECIWLVPLWPDVERLVRDCRLSNCKLYDLSTNLSKKFNKVQAIFRGRRLVARLTEQPPFPVFAFGDDLNVIESALIKFIRKRSGTSILIQDGLLDKGEAGRLGKIYGIGKNARTMRACSDKLGRMGLVILEWLGLVPPMRLYGLSGISKIAVYSSSSRDILVDRGVSQENIRITGGPRFDELFAASRLPTRFSNGKTILYIGLLLSQMRLGTVEHDRQWLTLLIELATRIPECRVNLRPHPSDDLSLYNKLMPAGSQAMVTIDKEKPLVEALAESDLVVMHFYSTVLYEAMIMNKSIILLKLKGLNWEFQNFDLHNDLLIKHVFSPEELIDSARENLEGSTVSNEAIEARENFLIKEMGYKDGGSSARIAQFIRETASDSDVC
jgi:hypothetical protein